MKMHTIDALMASDGLLLRPRDSSPLTLSSYQFTLLHIRACQASQVSSDYSIFVRVYIATYTKEHTVHGQRYNHPYVPSRCS